MGSRKNKSKEVNIPIQIEGEPSNVVIEPTIPSSNVRRRTSPVKKKEENGVITSSASLNADKPEDNSLNDSLKFVNLNLTITSKKQGYIRRLCYNVPEKIIIVLDCAKDEVTTNFQLTNGEQYSPLFMVTRALEIFLHNKSALDSRHQFALVLLNENSVEWVHDFTNDPIEIISTIRRVKECEPEDLYNMNEVFDLIDAKIGEHLGSSDIAIPPRGVFQVILLYGRSFSIPQFTQTAELETLLEHPYFIVDVVMTHEPPNSSNHSEKIFKLLQQLDPKGAGYIFSVTRNSLLLHEALGKLLGHPLQRPLQHGANTANYDIKSFKL